MGKIGMSGGGSSADLDVITAGAGDVLAGKVIVDQDGNPLTGTMANRGAVSQSLAINGSYTIPKGYHNGSGKVSQSVPTQGAKTITPGANQQQVAAGRYLTGAITVPGFSMPAANLIKKGAKITIYGRTVTGTWEGYVASNKDIYNRGAWGSGYSSNIVKVLAENSTYDPPEVSYDSTTIRLKGNTSPVTNSGGGIMLNKKINLSPYNTINVVVSRDMNGRFNFTIGVYTSIPKNFNTDSPVKDIGKDFDDEPNVEHTLSLNISNINYDVYLGFHRDEPMYSDYTRIHRIYFT